MLRVSQTKSESIWATQHSRHQEPLSHRQKFSNRAHAKRVTAAFIAAVLLWLPAGHASASKGKAPAATPEIAEKQADLGELRSRIEGLRKELGASEENKADAGDRLRESERQISRLQRELHELGNQRGRTAKKPAKPRTAVP